LSNIEIDWNLREILAKGLKFIPTPQPINQNAVLDNFSRFSRSLKLKWFFKNSETNYNKKLAKPRSTWEPENIPDNIIQYIEKTKDLLIYSVNNTLPYMKKNLNKSQYNKLNKIIQNKNIIIKPADKNLGITILSKNDYVQECYRQLHDIKTYRKVSIDNIPIDNIRHHFQTLLEDYKELLKKSEKEFLTYNWFDNYKLPNFYITPKVHKQSWQGRPIVASQSWITSFMSKFVDLHLYQLIKQRCNTVIKNSTEVINKIENSMAPNKIDDITIITADVTSLYTIIPHQDGINAVDNFLAEFGSAYRLLIVGLLKIIMYNNYFSFNNEVFHQLIGTAMGTACAPAYANIFLFMLERNIMTRYETDIWMYFRFLDDVCIICYGKLDNNHDLIKHLTSMHPQIKFTFKFDNYSNNFLDLTIYKGERWSKEKRLDVKLFQKDHNPYIYLPFTTDHPMHSKIGFITGELKRYVRNNSNEANFIYFRKLFAERLLVRGYTYSFIKPLFDKVRFKDRNTFLISKNNKKNNVTPILFVTTYDPLSRKINFRKILNTHWNLLQNIITSKPLVVYKKSKSIQDYFVKAKL
jgi:hypothetical protein